ncbi:DNA primase [Rhodohalobacter sp. 614A]|uniref:DNA primase n=1 Tax=Rhodohalobacter sp. 614A TaxID=2908649 RepID=UPI001F235C1B|nr:DNA primase [Rhodohalobacter sp. 614A]
MISDDKKEEIRAAADIVDVVGDYVKLKKSGGGFVGLCPFHDENTPSFHVTPRLGIYKCFGCGESGDVFNFVMEMEGIGFPETLRTLAERYGIDIPEDHSEEDSQETKKREGVLHALKFAGLFYHRQLLESPEAEKARSYLDGRGYPMKIWKNFGLGYAPSGSALLKEAQKEGIEEEYLLEADLIKPSNRGDGYFDSFRDRLMFPIFNPSGKLIAFAGRILNENKKTAKYINSSQTIVYNKSEVVYGVNFARNDIRKEEEVILVEGYTDVITMHQKGIKNVVASSGTSLTSGQIKILQRYGNRIVMIYDADNAGQTAMERGMNIALEQGMEVKLMELPEGEDPDSFVKQYGKESFNDFKKEHAEDFITFTIHKAENAGRMESPGDRSSVIKQILDSIARIPEELDRQVYVQHLHQKTQVYRKGSDRELFQQLDLILSERQKQQRFEKRREDFSRQRNAESSVPMQDEQPSHPADQKEVRTRKRPHYELEIIRLLLQFGENMRRFIGHNIGEDHFEDEQVRTFFSDIMKRHVDGEDISVDHYMNRESPYPALLGDILVDRHTISEKFAKRTGSEFKKDKNPILSAKSAMKPLRLYYCERRKEEISRKIANASTEEKEKMMSMLSKLQKEITRIKKTTADDLFDNPDFLNDEKMKGSETFEYKMKNSIERNSG